MTTLTYIAATSACMALMFIGIAITAWEYRK